VKQILCALLNNWPIDRALRRKSLDLRIDFGELSRAANCDLRLRGNAEWRKQKLHGSGVDDRHSRSIANRKSQIANPLIVIQSTANRQEVIAVSDEARAFGIRVGMTLAQARALCSHVEHLEHEPDRDAVALEALARWMMRFTPVVAIGSGQTSANSVEPRSAVNGRLKSNSSNHQPLTTNHLFLDLTGCERVFKGLDNILIRIESAMKRFRIGYRLAVAPTPGAAWAIAFASPFPPKSTIRDTGVPPVRVNLEQKDPLIWKQSARARRPCHDSAVSIPVIQDPSYLPRILDPLPPIALRISHETALALNHLGIHTIGQLMKLPRNALPARFGDELLLRLDQALGNIPEPLVPLQPFSPIQARMDFDGAVDNLEAIWIVFKRLVTRIVAELLKRGHGAQELEVEFYRPYAVTLHKTISLSRASRDPANLFNLLRCAMEHLETDVGFLGIKLIVSRSQRVNDEQIQLLEHEEFIAETELSHLIERLRIRLGNEVLAQPALVESYVPEIAYSWHRLSACVDRVKQSSTAVLDQPTQAKSLCHSVVRPLHLLKMPQEIRTIVSPSDDCEGFPISFTWKGQVHRLLHTTGPERIAGQWWQGHHRTRDYFDVEDEMGERFWVFRVRETNKWYVHGEYE
jgi:protein ImuB